MGERAAGDGGATGVEEGVVLCVTREGVSLEQGGRGNPEARGSVDPVDAAAADGRVEDPGRRRDHPDVRRVGGATVLDDAVVEDAGGVDGSVVEVDREPLAG